MAAPSHSLGGAARLIARSNMNDIPEQTWKLYGEAYAFFGNSLLSPMTQTASVGLDPAFWAAFPDFDSEKTRCALDACENFARRIGADADGDEDAAVERVSVEYTRLFTGPPSPAAPPWETMYRTRDATVGFGEATLQMRALLREAGLELRNENRQYEDHMGIELLYLSELCRRKSCGEGSVECEEIASFMEEHPLSWIGKFADRIREAAPDGYFAVLVEACRKVLVRHLSAIGTPEKR